MINIRELKNDLTDVSAESLGSILGAGLITGVGAAFGTTLGIGLYGLASGQSTQSIVQQQVLIGGPAFVGGFLTPGP